MTDAFLLPSKPVADLWFDNNRMIVLQAGTKEFRIPECILVTQSRVFKELLRRQASPATTDVHTVQLLERPDYAEYFIRALYYSGFFEPPPKRCDVDHALGILNLSTKYEVGYLRKRALSHLASGFPLTLEGWTNRLQTSTFQPITEYSVLYAQSNIPKTISILKILNEVGAVWLLPAALYECCRYDMKDIITNMAWTDGSLDNGLKNTIIVGYNRQVQEARRVLRFLQIATDENCPNPAVCLEVKRRHAEESFGSWNPNNPFGIWDDDDWELLDEMCAPCLEAAKVAHAKDRVDLWQRLPGLYDLPPWKKLLDLRDSAML